MIANGGCGGKPAFRLVPYELVKKIVAFRVKDVSSR
jgi:hypothetical protein